ncbi:STE3-domain-containing protein [Amylocystis lapponica]|nr:STE3-domain-containing protein [Amylocystis lapponica]
MHVELTVLSFLCAALLLGILPAYWSSRNVAMISLIVWLWSCNVIEGVNTVVWAGNSLSHIPIWCDIATKVLLGAQTALPAACLCLCRQLQRCTARIETKQRHCLLSFDFLLCITLPVVYMALHIIVQDYRFDLIEDFGCIASLYPSIPAIILIWLPPLVLCSITLVYACLAVVNYSKLGPATLGSTMADSRRLPYTTIARPLITSTVIVSLVISSVALSIYARITSSGDIQAWSSWALVHAHLSIVNVIPHTTILDLTSIEFSMWVVPASSLVLIISSCAGAFASGTPEETLGAYRSIAAWFRTTILRRPAEDSSFMDLRPHMRLKSPKFSIPVYRLKSMWDDTLRPSSPFKPKPARLSIPDFGEGATSAPTSSASDDSDAFMQSTLTYLESPTGRSALGRPPPQSSIHRPSKPAPLPAEALRPSPTRELSPTHEPPDSRPNSILSAPWPRPPSLFPTSPVVPITVSPPTPTPSPSHSRPGSICTSVASSTISAHAYARELGFVLHDAPPPPHLPPFADAQASAAAPGIGLAARGPSRCGARGAGRMPWRGVCGCGRRWTAAWARST